jgi:hypothetical protein
MAPITISNTTPASKTPMIRIMKGEKLAIISVVELPMLAVKSAGNAMNVSIIGQTKAIYGVCLPYMVIFLPFW